MPVSPRAFAGSIASSRFEGLNVDELLDVRAGAALARAASEAQVSLDEVTADDLTEDDLAVLGDAGWGRAVPTFPTMKPDRFGPAVLPAELARAVRIAGWLRFQAAPVRAHVDNTPQGLLTYLWDVLDAIEPFTVRQLLWLTGEVGTSANTKDVAYGRDLFDIADQADAARRKRHRDPLDRSDPKHVEQALVDVFAAECLPAKKSAQVTVSRARGLFAQWCEERWIVVPDPVAALTGSTLRRVEVGRGRDYFEGITSREPVSGPRVVSAERTRATLVDQWPRELPSWASGMRPAWLGNGLTRLTW